jgi:CubicO group peptidase (beta-lactamase class C family)
MGMQQLGNSSKFKKPMKTFMMKLHLQLIAAFIFLLSLRAASQNLYFPPLNNNASWDTLSPASLGWCANRIDSLNDYLQSQDTKAFIVLKDGKIVLENYFGTFTADSSWYWASAGKTITSFLVGKAIEENFLSLNDTVSTILGNGWTSCFPIQERKIKIIHQLTMTSGLDDDVPDNHCTLDTCLQCISDPGGRWAYHNAPYTLLEDVISTSTNLSYNVFTQTRLKNLTGMTGSWFTQGYNNVFVSKPRSMARFGLLIQNHCIWNQDTLLHDTAYVNAMTRTSQNLNKSYGYLWWLNGKASYMVPGSQLVIPGFAAPEAPADMFAAIGKNGQLLSVCRSLGLVFVRMGNQTSGNEVPIALLNSIWEKLNAVMCNPTGLHANTREQEEVKLFPNPTNRNIQIDWKGMDPQKLYAMQLINLQGKMMYTQEIKSSENVYVLPESVSSGSWIVQCMDVSSGVTCWRKKLMVK